MILDIGLIAQEISRYFASSVPAEKRFVPLEPFYSTRVEEKRMRIDLTDYAKAIGEDVDEDDDDDDDEESTSYWKINVGSNAKFPQGATVPVHIESVRFIQRLERCISQISMNGLSIGASFAVRSQLDKYVRDIEQLNNKHQQMLQEREAAAAAKVDAEAKLAYAQQEQRQRTFQQQQTGAVFPIGPRSFPGYRSFAPAPGLAPSPAPGLAAAPGPTAAAAPIRMALGPVSMQIGGFSGRRPWLHPIYQIHPIYRHSYYSQNCP